MASRSTLLDDEQAGQLARLQALRQSVLQELDAASTPAVMHALRMADVSLFLALGYLGYADTLMPQESWRAGGC